MSKNYSLYCLMVIVFLLTGCHQSGKTVNSSVSQHNQHNSANSLDWAGTYKGILPCADCEGIETELILNTDLTFLIKTSYLGKGNTTVEEKGSFTWNEAGNTIVLSGSKSRPNQYFVGENKLIQLDMSGKKIEGALADKYVLKKVQN